MLKKLYQAGKAYVPFLDVDDEVRARRAADCSWELLCLFREVERAYAEEKRRNGFLDFDDLLILARDMLFSSPVILKKLRAQYRAFMVDEFQDTNLLQREIVYLLCHRERGGNSLFVIGDEKQSIYRFRGADVSVFTTTREDILQRGGIALDLAVNYRSRPALLNFFNSVFGRVMPQFRGRRNYEPVYGALQPSRPVHETAVPCEFVLAEGDDGDGAATLREREARILADVLRRMVDDEREIVYERTDDKESVRPIRFGDIAVLFRAMTDVGIYERAFRERGIPYHLLAGMGFYGKQEIRDLVNFLRCLHDRHDGIALVGILRSPFFGVSDETLFLLSRTRRIKNYFLSMRTEWPPDISAAERRRLSFARSLLAELRAVRDRLSLSELIGAVIRRTGYEAVLATTFMGPQKIKNVGKFAGVARDFEKVGIFTLADFIEHINELTVREVREGEAPLEGEAGDVVRLMTVHKAKGLQFPCVVVPDMGRRPTPRAFPPVLWDGNWGLGCKIRMKGGGYEGDALYRWISREEQRKEQAESLRLFYVACTRARDYLILSAGTAAGRTERGSWMERLPVYAQGTPEKHVRLRVVSQAEQEAMRSGKGGATRARRHAPAGSGNSMDLLWRRSGPVEPPLPVDIRELTVTQLEVFRECPHRFFLRYVYGIPEPYEWKAPGRGRAVGAEPLGELVHAIVERWRFDETPGSQRGAIGDTIRLSAPLLDGKQRDALEKRIFGMLRTLSTLPLYRSIRDAAGRAKQAVLREQPFCLKLDDALIHGKIDLLYKGAGNGWHIVDYKTEEVTAASLPSVVERYRFQMSLYGLAFTEITGNVLQSVSLCFLKKGIVHRYEVNEDFFRWGARQAREIIERLKGGENVLKRSSCRRCSYRRICMRESGRPETHRKEGAVL
jgi:ATP-dependent helicase/nuclease subunit A